MNKIYLVRLLNPDGGEVIAITDRLELHRKTKKYDRTYLFVNGNKLSGFTGFSVLKELEENEAKELIDLIVKDKKEFK
mgnify:CR=1 FL=1